MTLLETLIVGSYLYATALATALYRLITRNHLRHVEGLIGGNRQRIQQLEDALAEYQARVDEFVKQDHPR